MIGPTDTLSPQIQSPDRKLRRKLPSGLQISRKRDIFPSPDLLRTNVADRMSAPSPNSSEITWTSPQLLRRQIVSTAKSDNHSLPKSLTKKVRFRKSLHNLCILQKRLSGPVLDLLFCEPNRLACRLMFIPFRVPFFVIVNVYRVYILFHNSYNNTLASFAQFTKIF